MAKQKANEISNIKRKFVAPMTILNSIIEIDEIENFEEDKENNPNFSPDISKRCKLALTDTPSPETPPFSFNSDTTPSSGDSPTSSSGEDSLPGFKNSENAVGNVSPLSLSSSTSSITFSLGQAGSSSLMTPSVSNASTAFLSQSQSTVMASQTTINLWAQLRDLPILFEGFEKDINSPKGWLIKRYDANLPLHNMEHVIISRVEGFKNFVQAVTHLLKPSLAKDANKIVVNKHNDPNAKSCNLVKFLVDQPVFRQIKEEITKNPKFINNAASAVEKYLEDILPVFTSNTLEKMGWDKKVITVNQISGFFQPTSKEQALASVSSSSSQTTAQTAVNQNSRAMSLLKPNGPFTLIKNTSSSSLPNVPKLQELAGSTQSVSQPRLPLQTLDSNTISQRSSTILSSAKPTLVLVSSKKANPKVKNSLLPGQTTLNSFVKSVSPASQSSNAIDLR